MGLEESDIILLLIFPNQFYGYMNYITRNQLGGLRTRREKYSGIYYFCSKTLLDSSQIHFRSEYISKMVNIDLKIISEVHYISINS